MIVRGDLPRGFQAAQIVHAAGESSPGDLEEGTFAVVLTVPDERQLEELRERLSREFVPHVAVREPDLPWCGQLVAIGIVPRRRSELRRHLSSLPLLR